VRTRLYKLNKIKGRDRVGKRKKHKEGEYMELEKNINYIYTYF
jgi:hypothetical protein